MSGGSKGSSSPAVASTPTAPVTSNVKMQQFGGVLDPAITQQLASAGLLGSMSNPSMFQPVNVPILSGPDDVRNYLASQGKSYINNDGTTVAGGAAGQQGSAAPFTLESFRQQLFPSNASDNSSSLQANYERYLKRG